MIQQGSRLKEQGEQTPTYEVFQLRQKGNPIQICWNYQEVTDEESGDINLRFLAVNVTSMDDATLRNAGVPEEIRNQLAALQAEHEGE